MSRDVPDVLQINDHAGRFDAVREIQKPCEVRQRVLVRAGIILGKMDDGDAADFFGVKRLCFAHGWLRKGTGEAR